MNITAANAAMGRRLDDSDGRVKTRILSAAIMLPVAILIWWVGGVYFALLVALLGLLMMWEWHKVAYGAINVPVLILSSAAIIISVGLVWAGLPAGALLWFVLTLIVIAAWEHAQKRERPWQALGLIWFGGATIAAVWLRMLPDSGALWVLWLMILAWVSDSGAYFAGKSIGGPKLAPRISPKKTWAGFIGGITAAGIAGFCVAYAIEATWIINWIILSVVLAAIGQGGDLLESMVKRHFGVKDSGHIIPGHGGILDRVDALSIILLAFSGVILLHGGVRPGWL